MVRRPSDAWLIVLAIIALMVDCVIITLILLRVL